MKAIAVLLVCLLALSVCSAEVKVLTSANFEATLKDVNLALVKFYAPWCGHCKKLAPEFKKASDSLTGKAVLAEVNCDDEKELCSKYGVRGYPTLHVFRNGEKAEDYTAGRSAPEVVKYVNANIGPAYIFASTKADVDQIKDADTRVIVMTSSKDSNLATNIVKIAPNMRQSMTFAIATNQAAAPDVAMESIAVYRSGDDAETFTVTDDTTRAEISTFLARARVPMFGSVGPATIQMYNELMGGNLGWLFVDQTDRDKYIEIGKKVAKKFRNDIIMLWVDTDLYGMVAEQLAIPKGTKFPAFAIDKNRKHHVMPLDQPITEESMTAFAEAYIKGEIKPTIKTAAVPTPETENGMTTIVGSRLRAIVDQGKDTMILFYAPWCGHCKTFHPIYDKIAKALEKSDVVIAKMDATENDVDGDEFTIQGFPTIYFVKAGEKKPISYEGDRSYDDVMKFIKKNAKATIATDAAAAGTDDL